jgi:hypothetical protein
MSTHHTPGPWKIGAYESGQVAVDRANGTEVTGFIDPADAQLIAAAPDLLDALRQVVAVYDGNHVGHIVGMSFDKARAAIAKATGGAA